MTRKEAIQKIKDLLAFKFEDVTPVAETKIEEKVEVKTDEVPAAEVKLEETTPATEVKLDDNTNIDINALQAEIADLRTKVQVLGDAVDLKNQFDYLKRCYDQMQAGFAAVQEAGKQTLSLVETIAGESTDEVIQTPKNTVIKKSKLDKYFA